MSNQDYYLPEESFSIMDIILVFAKQIKVIFITPIFTSIVTIIYVSYFAPTIYISNAKIISSTGNGNSISQVSGLAAQFGIALPNSQSEQQMIYSDLVKSRTLARKILKRKFNTIKYGSEKTLLHIFTSGATVGLDTLEREAVESVIAMIELNEDPRTGIYDLKVSTFEPQFARDLVSAIIEELDMHQRDYQNKQIGDARIFIENRIREIEKELNKAEEFLKEFRERNRRIENSPGLLLQQQRLSREVVVLTGVFTTLKQQLETTKIEEVKEMDYVIVIDPPETPIYRSKPTKRKTVVMSGITGIILGIFLGFIFEYLKQHKKDQSDKVSEIINLLKLNLMWFIPFSRKN